MLNGFLWNKLKLIFLYLKMGNYEPAVGIKCDLSYRDIFEMFNSETDSMLMRLISGGLVQKIIGETEFEQNQLRNRKIALVTLILCLLVGVFATPYIGCATMSYILIVVGFSLRKTNIQSHAKLMKIGMAIDLFLVLVLELTRSATATAFALKLGPLQQAHILFSTLAVVGYIPLFLMGRKHLKGEGTVQSKAWHKRIGLVTFAFRTLGFLFMFSMLLNVKS